MEDAHVHVVFGATGGIGGEVVRRLRAAGDEVLAVARGAERLEALESETGARTLAADATQFDGVDRAVGLATETWGRLDGLVNCVGSVLLRPAHMTSEDAWRETIEKMGQEAVELEGRDIEPTVVW